TKITVWNSITASTSREFPDVSAMFAPSSFSPVVSIVAQRFSHRHRQSSVHRPLPTMLCLFLVLLPGLRALQLLDDRSPWATVYPWVDSSRPFYYHQPYSDVGYDGFLYRTVPASRPFYFVSLLLFHFL
ncbi:hypothetical protein J6590_060251, partial [Homalodisca vitripennis]